MSNLNDKRELLKIKKSEFDEKIKSLDSLTERLKALTLSDTQFLKDDRSGQDHLLKQIQDEVNDMQESTIELKSQIDSLTSEINNEERTLNNLAVKAAKQKEVKMKGDNKMDYLKTKEALNDFAKMLQKTGGREALKEAWSEHLRLKGISNPDAFLPQAIISAITDAFDTAGGIFGTFRYTGLIMLKVALNTNTDDATSRAKGYKRGTTKQEQVITVTPKEIRAQYIYKYITLDKETLRETQDTGAILRYVLEELPQRIVREIERAAMIGDGRTSTADDKINSYEAILRTTADIWVSVQTSTSDLLSDLVNMDATITATGSRYLVISRQNLAKIKLISNNGGLVFPIGSDIASALGYSAIFTPDWMPTTSSAGDPVAIEYVGEAYKTVGDNTMDSYENFILQQNKNEYLMEIYSGGGIDTPKAAAVLVVPTP